MRPFFRPPTRATVRLAASSILLAFVFLPRVGLGQQTVPTPMNVQPAPDSVQLLMAEYQDKARRYTDIYNQAFAANEGLQTREAEINAMIMSALIESHPQAEQKMARLDAIETEAFSAQQDQDMEKLGQLITEANNLQAELRAVQEIVLQQADVRTRIDSFEAELLVAMVAIDPETESLRSRLDDLSAFLSGVQGGGF
jgi:hypothetical protein